jgi:hypothetical protein
LDLGQCGQYSKDRGVWSTRHAWLGQPCASKLISRQIAQHALRQVTTAFDDHSPQGPGIGIDVPHEALLVRSTCFAKITGP